MIAIGFILLLSQREVVISKLPVDYNGYLPSPSRNMSCQTAAQILCGMQGVTTVKVSLKNKHLSLLKATITQEDNVNGTYILHFHWPSSLAYQQRLVIDPCPRSFWLSLSERFVFIMVIMVLVMKSLVATKLRRQIHFVRLWWLNRELKRFGRVTTTTESIRFYS